MGVTHAFDPWTGYSAMRLMLAGPPARLRVASSRALTDLLSATRLANVCRGRIEFT
jgi:hypothetical protein